jgi:guanylate kinase
MDYPGNLFVVAAPSGAGKSSLVKALLELDSQVQPSVSHTTRPPRGQEKHGREYFFVPTQEFDQMVLAGAFVEWATCTATATAPPRRRSRTASRTAPT